MYFSILEALEILVHKTLAKTSLSEVFVNQQFLTWQFEHYPLVILSQEAIMKIDTPPQRAGLFFKESVAQAKEKLLTLTDKVLPKQRRSQQFEKVSVTSRNVDIIGATILAMRPNGRTQ